MKTLSKFLRQNGLLEGIHWNSVLDLEKPGILNLRFLSSIPSEFISLTFPAQYTSPKHFLRSIEPNLDLNFSYFGPKIQIKCNFESLEGFENCKFDENLILEAPYLKNFSVFPSVKILTLVRPKYFDKQNIVSKTEYLSKLVSLWSELPTDLLVLSKLLVEKFKWSRKELQEILDSAKLKLC